MNKLFKIFVWPFKVVTNAIDNVRIGHILKRATITDIDKISGVDFERVMAYIFKKMGFKVNPTPATGDYGADLIVTKWGIKIAVQCKLYYDHNVGNKAINEVYAAKKYYGCNEGMVLTNSLFTKQAITLSKSVDIILLDRNTLIKLLCKPYKNNDKIIRNLILIHKQNQMFSN